MQGFISDYSKEQALHQAISDLQGRGAMISYYQLQGFLFAIACSPEPIRPSEWFELIWLNDEPQFDDEVSARGFYGMVTKLADGIGTAIKQRQYLPFGEVFSDSWQPQLAEWCEGLLMAHQYLEDLWVLALEDLDDRVLAEDVDAALNLSVTFADLSQARQLSLEEGLGLNDEHLPEAYSMFWRMLETYARVGPLWAEGGWGFDAEQMFLALEPVARGESCPCGSGLPFEKCCLH